MLKHADQPHTPELVTQINFGLLSYDALYLDFKLLENSTFLCPTIEIKWANSAGGLSPQLKLAGEQLRILARFPHFFSIFGDCYESSLSMSHVLKHWARYGERLDLANPVHLITDHSSKALATETDQLWSNEGATRKTAVTARLYAHTDPTAPFGESYFISNGKSVRQLNISDLSCYELRALADRIDMTHLLCAFSDVELGLTAALAKQTFECPTIHSTLFALGRSYGSLCTRRELSVPLQKHPLLTEIAERIELLATSLRDVVPWCQGISDATRLYETLPVERKI